jgi:hypothetical protein
MASLQARGKGGGGGGGSGRRGSIKKKEKLPRNLGAELNPGMATFLFIHYEAIKLAAKPQLQNVERLDVCLNTKQKTFFIV